MLFRLYDTPVSARPPFGSLIHPTDVNPVAVEVEDAVDEVEVAVVEPDEEEELVGVVTTALADPTQAL